jgi:hypothetical protein
MTSVFDVELMVAVVVALALASALSVTLRVIVNVALVAYVCVAVADDTVVLVPSPQFHAYVMIVPVGSCEPLPLTLTAVPAVPLYGPPAFATGAIVNSDDHVSPNEL